MADWTEDQKTRLAMATILGAMVQAMDKNNPGFQKNFSEALKERYDAWRDNASYPIEILEAIKWANDSSVSRE